MSFGCFVAELSVLYGLLVQALDAACLGTPAKILVDPEPQTKKSLHLMAIVDCVALFLKKLPSVEAPKWTGRRGAEVVNHV